MLGGVLARFLTLWLAVGIGGLIESLVQQDWSSFLGLPVALAVLTWFYQPARIFRNRKYAGSSIPEPSRDVGAARLTQG